MFPTPAVLITILLVGASLCVPQVRTYLTQIALRRFYERYLSRPRYRVWNPRSEKSDRR